MQMKNLAKSSSKDATHLLGEWARITSTLYSTARFEVEPRSSLVSCAVLLPNREELRVQAPSLEAAAIQLTDALQVQLKHARCQSNWAPEWQALLNTTNASRKREAEMGIQDKMDDKERTKVRQETIGVTSKKSLYELLSQIASAEDSSIATIARSLVSEGFNDLENRMFDESPCHLLDEYERRLDILDGAETTQWMLRLNRHDSLRLKLVAKEYGRSVSQLAAMCLNEALQARMANGFKVPIEDIEAAWAAIQRIKGPAARTLSEQLGFTKSGSPLINGILSGRIEAPTKVFEMLSNVLDVSVRALRRVTAEAFQLSTVPSFKAGDTKPTVSAMPEAWEAAVRSLSLPSIDTNRLLHIDE